MSDKFKITNEQIEMLNNMCYGAHEAKLGTLLTEITDGANVAIETELERLQYYGDKDIIPSDESYFTVNGTGETITGLTDIGKTQTELVIPYKINGVEITSIGDSAFINCKSLTSINIPNSVTDIGGIAFADCKSLTSINIPNSVTSIESTAFAGCSSLTSINIPNSVTSIESSTFDGCSSLKSINIPDSVTSIGNSAFINCKSLTSINIPNSVTSIEFTTFAGCSNLTSITIGKSVTSIGGSAFAGCTNLKIYCEQGSYAETYAKENDIPVVYTAVNESDYQDINKKIAELQAAITALGGI